MYARYSSLRKIKLVLHKHRIFKKNKLKGAQNILHTTHLRKKA